MERLSKLDEEVKQVNEEYREVVLQAGPSPSRPPQGLPVGEGRSLTKSSLVFPPPPIPL